MDQQRLQYLFQQYYNKTASEAERNELLEYVANTASDEELLEEMQKLYLKVDEAAGGRDSHLILTSNRQEEILHNILRDQPDIPVPLIRRMRGTFRKLAAVLVGLLVLSVTVYFVMQTGINPDTAGNKVAEFAPGKNKAYLTLPDGSSIILDDSTEGEIASVEGVRIIKQADGKLLYEVQPSGYTGGTEILHTITTPRGGNYQVKLPDGSMVWLNASSSLRFPAFFTGNERRVELEGEGYFEVAKDATRRFRVVSANQSITVLGTHFNVSSYEDEPAVLTTVLEGKVRVQATLKGAEIPGAAEVLTVNEQSTLDMTGGRMTKKLTDVSQSVAWKAGKFQFQGTPISEVMRQFSRWYDFDFELEGSVPNVHLWGELSRNVNASEALELLKFFDLKYRVKQEGNNARIIVSR